MALKLQADLDALTVRHGSDCPMTDPLGWKAIGDGGTFCDCGLDALVDELRASRKIVEAVREWWPELQWVTDSGPVDEPWSSDELRERRRVIEEALDELAGKAR